MTLRTEGTEAQGVVALDFGIERLGEARVPSPMRSVQFVGDSEHVLYHGDLEVVREYLARGEDPPCFEKAGPRERIHFDPTDLVCGIVTCGGLCPGINDVIRAVTLSLHYHYGVQTVLGFRYGYEGLNPALGHEPLLLTPDNVETISTMGGTVLGTSRGEQPVPLMVDELVRRGVRILFTIGGDGTLRGAGAIAAEITRRGLDMAVVGIPKTIDNDISYIFQSFGFQTAAAEAQAAVEAAHTEAVAARNGIGLVKLMGRDSGFIAAYTALADSRVNYCLVPESPFTVEALLPSLRQRLQERGHAVIAVAEGAGQDLLRSYGERDASGNLKYADIGLFLRDELKQCCTAIGMEVNLKYIDPSYTIRSVPANTFDSAFSLLLGHNAVHAGMSGRTNLVVGNWRDEFTHVPIEMATRQRKKIDLDGWLWNAVLASTGQPALLR
jgi:6-phosphofructokinase 1